MGGPPCICTSWNLFQYGCKCGSFSGKKPLLTAVFIGDNKYLYEGMDGTYYLIATVFHSNHSRWFVSTCPPQLYDSITKHNKLVPLKLDTEIMYLKDGKFGEYDWGEWGSGNLAYEALCDYLGVSND